MKAPLRLLSDPAATPFEHDLLESWSHEQPSPAARVNALGIAGVAAAAAAGTAAGVGALAPKASALFSSAALAKWMIVGGVLVGGIATYGALSRSPAHDWAAPSVVSTTPAPPVAPRLEENAGAAAAATNSATVTEPPTLSPADLPAAAAEPVMPAATTSAQGSVGGRHGAASGARESTLGDEIALFERARNALDGGDAGGSLALLDTYERRFPSGTFAQEAEVLRVQALLRKGDRAGATRVGQRFLAAHPTSPHAARIRGILSPSER